jgi:hypothetical protein
VQLTTLAEHYGVPADEQVNDVTWIAESAQRGWIAFMKDANIRRRPAEREAIKISGARCFCLANANLPAVTMDNRTTSPTATGIPVRWRDFQVGKLRRVTLDRRAARRRSSAGSLRPAGECQRAGRHGLR